MSIISRYEVRLKCIELAATMSSSQDPLDSIFTKADKIYEWINNVGSNGNKKPHRGGKKQRYYSNRDRYDNDAPVKDYYAAQDDLFD